MGVLDVVKAGVLSGDDVTRLYKYAKEQGFALPAVNVVGSDSINAAAAHQEDSLVALVDVRQLLFGARIRSCQTSRYANIDHRRDAGGCD